MSYVSCSQRPRWEQKYICQSPSFDTLLPKQGLRITVRSQAGAWERDSELSYVIPAKAGIQIAFVIPCLTRNPDYFCIVPCFRRDSVWIPAYAGMTNWVVFNTFLFATFAPSLRSLRLMILITEVTQ